MKVPRRAWFRPVYLGACLCAGLAALPGGAVAQAGAAPTCLLDGKAVDPDLPASIRGQSGRLICRDPASNRVTRDAVYDDGQQLGLSRLFYPDGTLRRAAFRAEPGGDRAVAEFTVKGRLSQLRCADKPLLAPAVDDARLCGFRTGEPATVDLFDGQDVRRSRVVHQAGRRLRTESYYDNGIVATQEEQIGDCRFERQYASDGTRRSETVFLLERGRAVRISAREYAPNDLLLREQSWNASGDLLRDDLYYADSGSPRSTTRFKGDGSARTAEVAEYFPGGQTAFRGLYLAPARAPMQPVGTHQRFDAQGALVAESIYDSKGKWLRERAWGADGTLVHDDNSGDAGHAGTEAAKPAAATTGSASAAPTP